MSILIWNGKKWICLPHNGLFILGVDLIEEFNNNPSDGPVQLSDGLFPIRKITSHDSGGQILN